MYRASPPRKVAAWTKAAVGSAEPTPSAAADFVNLYRSTITHSGGFATPEFAILPDKPNYDHLRFSFGPVTQGGTVTSAHVSVYERLADGSVTLLGERALTSAGGFLELTVENRQATYAVIVSEIAGTTPTVSFDVFVAGVHENLIS